MRRSPQIQKHIFVLDTNVLLFDPNALHVFDEHDLMIPITVIEEIDRFKKDLNEVGRNARMVSRALDALRKKGSISEGVELGTGGRLWVQLPESDTSLPLGLHASTNDNIILKMVLRLAKRHAPGKVIFVTRDTNMRIKADALGIPAEDYAHAHLEVEETYSGVIEQEVPAEKIVIKDEDRKATTDRKTTMKMSETQGKGDTVHNSSRASREGPEGSQQGEGEGEGKGDGEGPDGRTGGTKRPQRQPAACDH